MIRVIFLITEIAFRRHPMILPSYSYTTKCVEKPIPNVFRCPNCDKVFKYKCNLTAHLKADCGKMKAFKCQICGKEFSYKQNLKTHVGLVHKILFPK